MGLLNLILVMDWTSLPSLSAADPIIQSKNQT